MKNPPDAQHLLERIAQGQVAAMQIFYQQFERSVYRYALSRLSDPFDAAEVLNDVMLDVWRQAGRFEGRSQVSTWLLGMARHKVLDRHRARGRHPTEAVNDDLMDTLADEQPTAEAALSTEQDAQRLRHCVDQLGPNHREVVHLAFYEELGHEAIAALMQCPLGTVKSRMHHAKEALKKCLNPTTSPT